MMTREDMLRELELLPVWQLRTPLASPDSFQAEPKLLKPVVIEPAIEKLDATSAQLLMHIGSEDSAWLFIMTNEVLQADEAQLLSNICKAMGIITTPEEMSIDTLAVIQARQPKMIISMGEPVTQMLLQSTEPLTKLRGKVYKHHDVTLIATYDLAHLLQNLPDKAKTWADLRLAMHTMQDL